MRRKLTKEAVKALEKAEKPYEVRDTEIKGFLIRVQPSGRMTYFLDYRTKDGRRNRYRIGSHGTLTAPQARDVAERLAGSVAHDVDLQAEKKAARTEAERRKVHTLKAFLERQYGPWATSHRKWGAGSVSRIEKTFEHLLSKPLEELNVWVIDKWRLQRRRAGKAETTINRDVASLRAVLSKAVEWGVLEFNPLAKLKPLRTDAASGVRYLSPAEEERLRQALRARDIEIRAGRASANEWRRARGYETLPDLIGAAYADHLEPMVLVAMNTGLRRGELFNLHWSDVEPDKAMLTVVGARAKSGQTRHIHLNQEALGVLRAWKEQQSDQAGYVFPGREGARLDNVKSAWRGLLTKARISSFRFHDLRHYSGSRIIPS